MGFLSDIAGIAGTIIGGAIGGPAGASIGGSIGGAVGGASASRRAAGQVSAAERRAMETQREMFETIRGDYAPYREAGRSALDAMLSMTGLPGLSVSASPRSGNVELTPEGMRGALRGAGVRGAMGRIGNPGAGPTLTQRSSMYGGGPVNNVLFPLAGMQQTQSNRVPSIFESGYIARANGGRIRQGGRYTLSEYGHPEAIYNDAGGLEAVTTQPSAMTSPINGTVVPLPQIGGLAQTSNPMPGSSVGENPGGQPGRYNFMTDPGYQFRMDEGTRAIERSAAARGMGLSGSVLRELARYGQGLGSQEYQNVYNRVSGIANLGAGGLAQTSQYGYGTAGNIAGNQANIGSAQAAGTMGRNSAYQGILDRLAYGYGSGQTPPIMPQGSGNPYNAIFGGP